LDDAGILKFPLGSKWRSWWSGGETRAGSNPAFGTMLETKEIPVETGVPFLIGKRNKWKFYGSLE
jgi:hypothetical protein